MFIFPLIVCFSILLTFYNSLFKPKRSLIDLVRKNIIIKLLWLCKSHSWASHHTGDLLLKHNFYVFSNVLWAHQWSIAFYCTSIFTLAFPIPGIFWFPFLPFAARVMTLCSSLSACHCFFQVSKNHWTAINTTWLSRI